MAYQIKSLFLFFFIAATLGLSATAEGQEIPPKTTIHQQDTYGYSAFLTRLGFEDLAAELRSSLENKNFLNKTLSPKVLTYQIQRVEKYNYARFLATEILNSLHTTNRSPESREKIVQFALRLLDTKPVEPPTRLPTEFENNPDKATIYLMERTRNNIETQSELLMADLIHTLYGKSSINEVLNQLESNTLDASSKNEIERLAQIQKKMNALVQFMYLDNEMGSFSVTALGKALVLGMTRHQILKEKAASRSQNENFNLITKLKMEFKKYHHAGLYYENYVGDTLLVNTSDGKVKKIEIKNGDYIFERSFGKQANEITAGARPSGIKNWFFAAQLGLLGRLAGRYLHHSDEDVVRKPGFWDYVYKKLRESKFFTNGVSHAGIAEVLKDSETGMKTTRSWDSYIDAENGGMRVTDILHQFAKRSEYLRLVVSRPDVKKLANYVQEYVKKIGYKDVIQMGDYENKDGSIRSEDTVPWKAKITKNDFEDLHTLAHTNPFAYSEEVGRRVVLGMKDLFHQGLAFAYHFSNSYGRAYCTSAIVLSFLSRVGIDPQSMPDRWNYIVRIAKRISMPGIDKVDMVHRVTAPGGLIWQRQLIDPNDIQIADYPLLTTEERIALEFAPERVAMDPELHRRLRTQGFFVKATQDGVKEVAANSVLITEIEDMFALRKESSKFGDVDRPRGRARSSYLGRVDHLLATAERNNTSAQIKKSDNADVLMCPKVFRKK
ncbi:MAG: hypothetical protein AABY64_04615 [Bdellovibrionota bacterium]